MLKSCTCGDHPVYPCNYCVMGDIELNDSDYRTGGTCDDVGDMVSVSDIGIPMVWAHVVIPEETVCIGRVPESCMYQILDSLSQDGKYEVFATEDGGKVVGHLMPVA